MYLLMLVVTFHSYLMAVHSCPSLCACGNGSTGIGELRWVQCSDPGISAVPINAPANTVKLRLEKTSITRVPRAAFYNLSELQFLWLTYNSITSIHPSSFVNLKALRELRLDGNLLSAFPWEGLRDMPYLRTLGLHNNRLSSLPAHAALFLPNITYLDLSSNRLTILPAELLDLWFPLPGQQGGPVQRRVLGLHDNPWLCDCQISMAMSLSMSLGSPVVLMDQLLTCSRSLGQSGLLLTQADLSRCMRPSVQPAATRIVSPLGSNVILRCDATGYPTPTLTWIKASAYTVMQKSPRVGVRWSIISLNGLSYKDAGEYRCQARNMAGISEAPIKLKVVAVTGASRFPKIKSQKTLSKSLSKNRKQIFFKKPKPSPAASSIFISKKDNQTLISVKSFTPVNETRATAFGAGKVVPTKKYIKRRKINLLPVSKRKTRMFIKTTPELPGKSTSALLSETETAL
ncbi:leucine-rich repeat, immunoglobulin-like domain and transmembrane domain-containing protein 3b [Myripristis murdjan]|uniref:leucine-rich repeat, immunoglobulin-like domain and transmembrane domain-containing protein 3b n=1 Tax=Myripristis murdjan TaxID=586833 RepID=UPI0011760AE9|nr:leucine-rich repeat, immunoglobulin-like domain and transmembrane domain-containing protein 3 [Myripristis murdjan]